MITVYVIESTTRKYRYVGIINNLHRRLKEHDAGVNKSTKSRGKYKLIHKEVYPDYINARKREIFLKSGTGRKWLDKLEFH